MGPFEEEREGTGVASDVVKVQGEDPATPGPLPSGMMPTTCYEVLKYAVQRQLRISFKFQMLSIYA